MPIEQVCPDCKARVSIKQNRCKCGKDLYQARRKGRVFYNIRWHDENGRERREKVGYSLKEAQDRDSAKRVEEPTLESPLGEKVTFQALADWYMELETVKALVSCRRVQQCLDHFNRVYGGRVIGSLKKIDLQNYQTRRGREGAAPRTIDYEISVVKTMLTTAWDNDVVSEADGARQFKAFRSLKKKLRLGANRRTQVFSPGQYVAMIEAARDYMRLPLVLAFNTGMRKGEILKLQHTHLDWGNNMIRLPAELVKENMKKNIPMNKFVQEAIKGAPRALHGYVVDYFGKRISHKDSLKNGFIGVCETAGVPYGRKVAGGLTFHDIRRTFKSNLLKAGVRKALRDAIVGHTLQGMDRNYLVITEGDLLEAMNQFTEWWERELEKVAEAKAAAEKEEKEA